MTTTWHMHLIKGTIVCGLFFEFEGNAQNLVSNSGFEQYSHCPDYVSQINYCDGWERPTDGTSDYFNSCLGVPFSVSVPDNQFGFQQPANGNGYVGLYAFYSPVAFVNVPEEDHEYISSQLVQPLQPGKTYYAEFKVSLSEASRYAVSELGMLFSNTKPSRNDELAIQYIPQVTNVPSAPLSDKTGWILISGCFVADSAYEFITIGNFNSGMNTVFTNVGTQSTSLHFSYYYVDDVLVKEINKPEIEIGPFTCGPAIINITNYNNSYQYLWSDGSTAFYTQVSSTGFYLVSEFAGECWVSSDSIEVIIPQPIDFSLGNDTAINFCVTNVWSIAPLIDSISMYSYLWSTGTTTNNIEINSVGTYILTVTDSFGCNAVQSINVEDLCDGTLYFPNAFSPNNDGRNEEFYCLGSNIREMELTVFNRWGEIVFHTTNMSVGWDGNGAVEGIYVWKVTYFKAYEKSSNQIIEYGTVSLLR